MDSRRDFTTKKVFPGYFPELSEKANSGLVVQEDWVLPAWAAKRQVRGGQESPK